MPRIPYLLLLGLGFRMATNTAYIHDHSTNVVKFKNFVFFDLSKYYYYSSLFCGSSASRTMGKLQPI